jgi:hypothetical protein
MKLIGAETQRENKGKKEGGKGRAIKKPIRKKFKEFRADNLKLDNSGHGRNGT